MTFFTDLADFRKYCSVNTGFELSLVENDFTNAFYRFVLPYLSQAQYDASKTNANALHVELMRHVKSAIANLGMMLYFPVLKVNITTAGIQSGVPREKQLNQADKDDLFRHLQDTGFQAIEQMLLFLETNKATFTPWAPVSTELNKVFLRNATEFNNFLNINSSRRFFLTMSWSIDNIEQNIIEPLLPDNLYSNLHTALAANTLSAIHQKLLNGYVRPALAHLAMASSSFTLADTRMVGLGVCLLDADYVPKRNDPVYAAVPGSITYTRQSLQKKGDEILAAMTDFIEANAADLGITLPTEDTLIDFPYIRNKPEWGTVIF